MGIKRKVAQVAATPIEQQPRRSKRNTIDKLDDGGSNQTKTINAAKLNGESTKSTSTTATTKATIAIKSTAIKTNNNNNNNNNKLIKQTAKAIVNESIDFNKDPIPIRTYGKSDQATTTQSTTANTTTPTRLSSRANLNSKATTTTTTTPTTTTTTTTNNKVNPINKIVTKTIKKKTAEVVQHQQQQKKKGNLIINSSPTTVTTKAHTAPPPPTTTTIGNLGTTGQKIIINKIITIANQNPTSTTNNANNKATVLPQTTQVPVQLLNNFVLPSNIKFISNPGTTLTLTNPVGQQTTAATAGQTVLATNILPINQLNNKNPMIITSPNQQLITTTQTAGGVKQLQLPIIIKSIVPSTSTTSTQPATVSATALTLNSSSSKVAPISTVNTRTPERAIVNIDSKNNKKIDDKRKTRVSFDVNKNTSTVIKPISSDLPITASNALLTSTPKQSIIKKAKVFDLLPCTPIPTTTGTTIGTRRIALNRASAATTTTTTTAINNKPQQFLIVQQPPTTTTIATAAATTISADQQAAKNKIETVQTTATTIKNSTKNQSQSSSALPEISVKYCKQAECNCWNLLPKSDVDKVKKIFNSLNAPKKALYIYCTTIKLRDNAKFDFEKYVFYVRTQKGYIQVCHRVYMDIFDKQNLSFVDTALKRCEKSP